MLFICTKFRGNKAWILCLLQFWKVCEMNNLSCPLKRRKNEVLFSKAYSLISWRKIFFKFELWPPLSGGYLHCKWSAIWTRHHKDMDEITLTKQSIFMAHCKNVVVYYVDQENRACTTLWVYWQEQFLTVLSEYLRCTFLPHLHCLWISWDTCLFVNCSSHNAYVMVLPCPLVPFLQTTIS